MDELDNKPERKVINLRPQPGDMDIIRAIQEAEKRPGITITISAALRIALHAWEEQNRQLEMTRQAAAFKPEG